MLKKVILIISLLILMVCYSILIIAFPAPYDDYTPGLNMSNWHIFEDSHIRYLNGNTNIVAGNNVESGGWQVVRNGGSYAKYNDSDLNVWGKLTADRDVSIFMNDNTRISTSFKSTALNVPHCLSWIMQTSNTSTPNGYQAKAEFYRSDGTQAGWFGREDASSDSYYLMRAFGGAEFGPTATDVPFANQNWSQFAYCENGTGGYFFVFNTTGEPVSAWRELGSWKGADNFGKDMATINLTFQTTQSSGGIRLAIDNVSGWNGTLDDQPDFNVPQVFNLINYTSNKRDWIMSANTSLTGTCTLVHNQTEGVLNETKSVTANTQFNFTSIELPGGKNYLWYVICANTFGNYNVSETNETILTNSAPSVPTFEIPTPADNARDRNNFTINWSSTDNEGDTITYYLWMDTNNPPTTNMLTNSAENNFTTNMSDGDTTYYYQVLSSDGFTNSSKTSIRSFTLDSLNPLLLTGNISNNNVTVSNQEFLNVQFLCTDDELVDANFSLKLENTSIIYENNTQSLSVANYSLNASINWSGYSDQNFTFDTVCSDSGGNVAVEHFYVIKDTTNPSISLTPVNGFSSTTAQQTLEAEVTDNYKIANCSMYVNQLPQLNLTSNNTNLELKYTETFAIQSHKWYTTCTDSAGNIENSSEFTFTILAGGGSSGGGGGGGGGGVSEEEVEELILGLTCNNNVCDRNENIVNCPNDCKLNFDTIVCFDTDDPNCLVSQFLFTNLLLYGLGILFIIFIFRTQVGGKK